MNDFSADMKLAEVDCNSQWLNTKIGAENGV
jgi:hypothetical protein